ncbi:MAG: N-acetyl-gamma-glutamyl-phosphate reductase [Polyangiaceae bacterium]|nr:N-acetyl-gamma-glutamyl-phosphate reductase [Polyangiaceae bacterium]
MASARTSIGLVGARGYVGRELARILLRHPRVEIAYVVSRGQAGQPVSGLVPGAPPALLFEDLSPEAAAARGADAVVLALPNDLSPPWVAAIERARPGAVIVDVSSDHRLDDGWVYGLPELHRARIAGARRIANPGCYATAAALSVRPVAELLAAPACAFGVSGYSGAGTTPSPRNDVEALRDNLMPYSLVGHAHEREVTRHAGPVALMPHVAPFFRGITVTVSMTLGAPLSREALRARYEAAYAGEPLVKLLDAIPLVRDAANHPHASIGGFAVDEPRRRAVVVATLDNLLKGAASQAVQNLNLALGFPELEGLDPWPLDPGSGE